MAGPDSRLVALMTQTVKLYQPLTTDVYGNHTWAAPITVNCHINHRVSIQATIGQIYLAQIVPGLNKTWRIEVPEPDDTWVEAIIVFVKTAYDENGANYQMIVIGEATEKKPFSFQGGGSF